jgi:hypothetical protein
VKAFLSLFFSALVFMAPSIASTAISAQETQLIEDARTQLKAYITLQKTLKIQNAVIAYGMKKALTMADLLVSADGLLNLSLCQAVKSAFISTKPEEYEVNMSKVLDQLDTSWDSLFQNTRAPKDPSTITSLLLHSLFGLAPDQPVTDRHAKVALLAAMLAPYNQGPVGDCFAVNAVIRNHREYYRHAAEDYRSILMFGYIDRPVNNHPDYFFFLPILADDDRDKLFAITSSGAFPKTSYFLFDAPGFAAARSLIGGNSIPTLLSDVMLILAKGADGKPIADEKLINVTPSQVIRALAAVVASKSPNENVAHLTALGEYAFSSLTNNVVLRGVEAAFAAMAEDRVNDFVRGNINSALTETLKSSWSQLGTTSSEFQRLFTALFNDSYRLLYNLNIPLPQVSADGSSTDGGFQLYQRKPGVPSAIGVRVSTPEEFETLVSDAVTTTVSRLGSAQEAKTIADQLLSVIHTEAFLRDVLWNYEPANRKEPHPVKNYQKLSRTPMQSCDGDNPYEVDDIDTQTSYDGGVQSYTSHNAKDLITWCLGLAKRAPPEMIPMDSPQHAFNFMPTNPDLVSFIKKGATPSQWIQKQLVIPGIQVSSRELPINTKQVIAETMLTLISDALSDKHSYDRLTKTLFTSRLSVQEYAQKLLDGINTLLRSDADQAHRIALALDGVVLQSLPAKDQAMLQDSAIRFAFTNWNQGTDNIYFCAFFNPRTRKVGFGTILEDKTNLQPMDEDEWVNNQQWDVNLSPFAPKT